MPLKPCSLATTTCGVCAHRVGQPFRVNLPETPTSTKREVMRERLLELLSRQLVRVRGESMAPTLSDGQWVVVSRRAYTRRPPSRFDVVRFEDPWRPGSFSIKRVVGLPLEVVELRGGELVVDGRTIEEPHAVSGDTSEHLWAPRENEYVVLGDNRSRSTDSRRYGPIRLSAITGAVRGHANIP